MARKRIEPPVTFNPKTGEYRDASGQVITQKDVVEIMNSRITESTRRLEARFQQLVNPRVDFDLNAWNEQMAIEIRNLHVQMAILGRGSRDLMESSDWGRVGSEVKKQYKHLKGFAGDLSKKEMTFDEVKQRMSMYSNAAWKSMWKSRTKTMKKGGFTEEKRVLQPAEHCPDCIRLAGKWAPIGSLPEPGDGSTRCLTNDKCIKIYR